MADGSIKISIEVDGKQVDVAAKQLENLEASGNKSGKGIKAAEDSLDSLSDKSAKAGTSVKGAGDSIEGLGESGSKAGQGLKGAEGAIDSVADKSAQASSSVKGAGDTIEGLGSSGDSAASGLKGVDGALDGVTDSSDQASKSVQKTSDEMGGVGEKTNQASGSIKTFAASIGLVAIAAKAFDMMTSSVDQAISRFDTLNAFPKVLQALGVSAEDSEAAMGKLSDGIDGLPTKLNDIAANAQRMYTSFGDMDRAADSALALNNALLGSGASSDQAKRGTEQYIKALQRGSIDLNTWTTLSETMDVGLVKIAEGFGYAGKTAKDDLYKALQDGSITMDEFNDKLIEVGTGTGIMAQLAKENSLGLATSFGNLRNAIANGVAKIIEAFNELSKAVTGKEIAEHIDGMKVVVNAAFNLMKSTIEATTPVFKFFADAVGIALAVIKPLTPAIIGVATAYTALMIVNKIASFVRASTAALMAAEVAQKGLVLATKATVAAKAADTAATLANTGAITASTLAMGVLTGRIGLATAAKIAFAAASKTLSAALGVMSGPIGWITLAIGGLVGATIGIVKWFNKATEEGERLKGETEALGESTNELTDSMEQSNKAYEDRINSIDATREANSGLVETVKELSDKENKSADDKRDLSIAVSQLNGEVEGLNATYNEEADMLSESTEKMQARIELMAEQDKANAAQERLTEILKEQQEVELQLGEVNELRKEWNRKLNDGTVKSREHKKAIEELDTQEQTLKDTNEQLGIQYDTTKETMVNAQNEITKVMQDGNAAMIISYEDLSEAQQAAFDEMEGRYESLKDAATDSFDKINDETELTMSEMIENLEHNQQMVEAWGENYSKLMAWASENGYTGFMEHLDSLGIDSAAELQEMADSSDEELTRYAELMDTGADKASTSFNETLGDGFEHTGDIVTGMVDDTATTMQEQIMSSGFDEIGRGIPNDVSEGIDGGADDVQSATSRLAETMWTGMNLALGNYDFIGKGEEVPVDLSMGMGTGSSYVEIASRGVGTDAIEPMTAEINNADIEGTGNSVSTRLSGGIDSGKGSVETSSTSVARAAENSVSSEITQSKFETYGGYVTTGLSQGISGGSDDVSSAGSSMSESLLTNVRSKLGINSPSTIAKSYGDFFTQGLAIGISNGESSVVNNIISMATSMLNRTKSGMDDMGSAAQTGVSNMDRRLARLSVIANSNMRNMQNKLNAGATNSAAIMTRLSIRMISAFSSLPGRMSSVGGNAMSGLNVGLNRGAGRVMSTARSIANRVASTMQRALAIHSPSRVMRDDVGKQVPAGVAVGIKDNAKLVYRALDDLAAGMIKPVSPEVALGTSAMAYNGSDSVSQAVRNIKFPEQTNNNHAPDAAEKQPAVINLYVGSKQVAREIVDDITNLQNRQNNRKKYTFKGGMA
ncbi:tape measure protein [Oceanobacillus sojae]|uniref:tape measure protein n=1 Tax=Oceanobacillus sojae TaxID=582851 RepID=UPI0021A5E868|nr:tape measure protein [Oceanobacillus sojae]MCT1904121.1 tape measure protein [Oceanobacillus sojae]